jgi:predicted nucleotidyltransferase
MNNIKRDIDIDFAIAASEFIQEENLPNLAYLCLYGSQNYNLDTFQSDIDIKGFVYPTVEDIALNRSPITGTGVYERGSEGAVSVTDIRQFAKDLKKSNINALEFLYSPYFMFTGKIFTPADAAIRELKAYRNGIVYCDPEGLFNSARGVAYTQIKRLEKPQYEKWHKGTANVLRVANFIHEFDMTGNYEDSLKAFPVYSRDMIMSIKAGEIPRDLCEGIAAEAINKIDKIGEFKVESNRNYVEAVDEIMVTMVKHLYGGGVK